MSVSFIEKNMKIDRGEVLVIMKIEERRGILWQRKERKRRH